MAAKKDGRSTKQYVDSEEMTASEYIRELAVSLYMTAVFVLLPLLLKDKYRMLGTFKYEVFRFLSFAGLGIIFLTEVSVIITSYGRRKKASAAGGSAQSQKTGGKGPVWKFLSEKIDFLRRHLSATDWFVAGYGICVIISFFLSVSKAEAFWGTKGWYMGLVSQLIFVVSYFVVSRWWSGTMGVWYAACGAAFVAFLFGVLHRFSIDPFGLYKGLSDNIIKQYLSFLGQNTWYSSYMCTVFQLGLFLFWGTGLHGKCALAGSYGQGGKRSLSERHGNSKGKRTRSSAGGADRSELGLRLAGGVFCAVGFASWVTQNSDSAYIALALILLVLFCLGFQGNLWMERFLEVVLLMLFSFTATGFAQEIFADRAVLPEALSLFFSQGILTIVSFIVVCICYIMLLVAEKRDFQVRKISWLGKTVVILFIVGILAGVALIMLNTSGILNEWFGFSSRNNYLLFNDDWGNGRGRTWSFSVQMIKELPFYRKLFGVGPDCFAFYGYNDPEYAAQLTGMWGNSTLTNAHCEWMTQMLCLGLTGLTAYAGIFVTAVFRYLKAAGRVPVLAAIALCLLAYTGHNVFCYQQALCTPFVFIILGMGERIWQLEADR